MGKVTAGDGSALSFLCARVLENIAADPSPPVTRPASASSPRAPALRAPVGVSDRLMPVAVPMKHDGHAFNAL
jgi:hypothetical protein